jgi:hypothetical protein
MSRSQPGVGTTSTDSAATSGLARPVGRSMLGRVTAVLAAVMAAGAYGGAVGLAGDDQLFGPLQARVHARLPFHSFVLGAVALACIVALPMTAAAISSWRGTRHAGTIVVLAGALLVGWIIGEVAVVRIYFWLQPACLGYGLVLMVLGERARRLEQLR